MNDDSHKQDGLEEFFRDRLFSYQDEPSSNMWDRIEGAIPKKPVRNYKAIATWSGAAVASCLILSLGFFTFQYKQQLDGMAAELDHTRNNMASLEERLNDAYHDNSQPIAAAVVEETDRNLNTNPRIKEVTKYYPQIVYLPSENNNSSQKFIPVENNMQSESSAPTAISTTAKDAETSKATTDWQFAHNTSVMQSGNYAYYDAKQNDILDLKKKILPKRSPIRFSKKNINPKYQSKRFHIAGNQAQFVNSNTKTEAIATIMNTRSTEQQMKKLNFSKLNSIGAELNVSSSLSLFMMPDYLESLHTPNTLGTNELYPYSVGLETGFAYKF